MRWHGRLPTARIFEFIAEVRDANGNPVSGVTTNWTSTAGGAAVLSVNSQQTDAAGNATVKLTSTKTPVYDIVVSAALAGQAAVNADKKVSFEELFSTSVLVIDAIAAGDKPVNGAHVKIFSEDGSELLYETTTGATGKFKVDLVGGKYAVKITANNYDDYDDFMDVKSGADTNFKFALSPALGSEFGRIILQWVRTRQTSILTCLFRLNQAAEAGLKSTTRRQNRQVRMPLLIRTRELLRGLRPSQ